MRAESPGCPQFGSVRFCLAEKRGGVRCQVLSVHPGENGGQPVMLDLQRGQFEHDERFHREITRLPINARLNHMALHFCKYTGQFARVCASGDHALRAQTITDSFIISLCSANALNLDLSQQIAPDLTGSATLKDIGTYLAKTVYRDCPTDSWLLITHASHAAQMARACEKIDHLEDFPFRQEIQKAVLALCQTTLVAAVANDIDLSVAVYNRRRELRDRAAFLSQIYAE